ncbi:hypothetical protein ACFWRZ_09140 [Streptomyces rubiginosohelvolus]|uniref:hypothetical protein n=1 Tax=Streptomyces rubiginosohelvolus TaxID=67362 RepID=UPI0036616689
MPLPLDITRNPERLAEHLRAQNLPGQRSKTAITRLRAERRRRSQPMPPPLSLARRAHDRLLRNVRAEIERRGGETTIEGKSSTTYLEITDRQNGMVLVHADGWRYYSSRVPARPALLSYLWGPDDAGSGPWAVRVPGTVTTVAVALEWLTPAAVQAAQAAGMRVRRQGDVYAVETQNRHDGKGAELLPESHAWRPDTRYLVHQPADGRRHRPVRLPWPVRFVQQTAYGMGRTNSRTDAD